MRSKILIMAAFLFVFGCGDAAEVEEPAPETTSVELLAVTLTEDHGWSEIESLTFTLEGHGFERNDVHRVMLVCKQECIAIGNVALRSGGEEVLTGERYYSDSSAGIELPVSDGDQTIDLTMSSHSDPVILSVVAEVLK